MRPKLRALFSPLPLGFPANHCSTHFKQAQVGMKPHKVITAYENTNASLYADSGSLTFSSYLKAITPTRFTRCKTYLITLKKKFHILRLHSLFKDQK